MDFQILARGSDAVCENKQLSNHGMYETGKGSWTYNMVKVRDSGIGCRCESQLS